MQRESLIMFCTSDLSGQVRGKAIPAADLELRLRRGLGWTPTNLMLTPFGGIADSPWASRGDVRLMADANTKVSVNFDDGSPAERFYLCNIQNTDSSPWDCCLRTFLRTAVNALEDATGLRLMCAFEQEFYYSGSQERAGRGYCLEAFRRQGRFGETLMAALDTAGLEPESFLPEFGPGQYEVTCRPADALTAADRAIAIRELARAVAYRLGEHVSFAPLMTPDAVGNGVHVHLSLRDTAGQPVGFDSGHEHGMGEAAGQFAAGLLRHAPALTAITASSVVSYLRLVPDRWSAAFNNLGYRDREAYVRIAPIQENSPDAAAQFNLEFRAADAIASPYLVLGSLIYAGLQGLREELPTPVVTLGDPRSLGAQERARAGISWLPRTLSDALDALEADATAKAWFPPALLDAFFRYKRDEVATMREIPSDEQCIRYAGAY